MLNMNLWQYKYNKLISFIIMFDISAKTDEIVKSDIWFHFKEGFNNAVRRSVDMKDLYWFPSNNVNNIIFVYSVFCSVSCVVYFLRSLLKYVSPWPFHSLCGWV